MQAVGGVLELQRVSTLAIAMASKPNVTAAAAMATAPDMTQMPSDIAYCWAQSQSSKYQKTARRSMTVPMP